MTLLVTVFAAIIATIVWYCSEKARLLKVEILSYTYWGAAMMFFADAVFEYKEKGAEYFFPSFSEMVNDLFLGFSAVELALIVWVAILLFTDPCHIIQKTVANRA